MREEYKQEITKYSSFNKHFKKEYQEFLQLVNGKIKQAKGVTPEELDEFCAMAHMSEVQFHPTIKRIKGEEKEGMMPWSEEN